MDLKKTTKIISKAFYQEKTVHELAFEFKNKAYLIVIYDDRKNDQVLLCTCGLGQFDGFTTQRGETIEIYLKISGQFNQEKHAAIAKELDNFITTKSNELIPTIKKGSNLLKNNSFSQFKNKKNLIIESGGIADYSGALKLFSISPITEAEASYFERVGLFSDVSWDVRNEILFSDPLRMCFFEKESEKTSARKSGNKEIDDFWEQLLELSQKHNPVLYKRISESGSASMEDLQAVEKNFDVELPIEFKESWMLYTTPNYDEYEGLSPSSSIRRGNEMIALMEDKSFAKKIKNNKYNHDIERIQPVHFDPKWIPFAQDGGGNMLCIDMNPGPNGNSGQVIQWELRGGGAAFKVFSFPILLESSVRKLSLLDSFMSKRKNKESSDI